MIKRVVFSLCLVFIVLLMPKQLCAQYYSWGSDAPSLKWNHIGTPDIRMVYPDTVSGVARQMLYYLETVRPDVNYGFREAPMRVPFVLHPENFSSNGLVMWMPKRVDVLTTPDVDGYSMLWYKHLAAHEYRHVVQYANLDKGFIRIARYILGEQGAALGLLLLPLWVIEGDAVMFETEVSSFGRGLQPNFTMEYRAMQGFSTSRKNIDKWFCGSYKEYIPDHYKLGYQICSYTYTKYNENVWDKVAIYGARNPYVISTTNVPLKKFYDTSTTDLFYETFADLDNFWGSLSPLENSGDIISSINTKNYTTYSHPLALGGGDILALKSDLAKPSRFVRVDGVTGEEETIAYTGAVSSRPVVADGRVWWSEYRRSTLFSQRVNSQLCYMDLEDEHPRSVRKARNVLYPTAMDGGRMGWIEYTPDGRYHVVEGVEGVGDVRYATPLYCEIHGLAWDDSTKALYTIVTDDSGMWLGRVDGERGVSQITKGAYITINNLRAEGGKLYFGSIESGRDEAHCFDLATSSEYRMTNSTYGSFAPSVVGDTLYMTTYDRYGYHLAKQATDAVRQRVDYKNIPTNILNPKRVKWDVVNLDTVRFLRADSLESVAKYEQKRYRKAPRALNVHSWFPISQDPFEILSNYEVNINVGVTLLSQNLLSNTEASLSYGWNRYEGSLVGAKFKYFGWGVHLDVEADYGGNQVVYPISHKDDESGEMCPQPMPAPDKYYSVGTNATLPLLFQTGYHTKQLSIAAGWNYSNGMVSNVDRLQFDKDGSLITNIEHIGYKEGLHKLSFGIGYSDMVRLAHRDFVTPKGFMFSANYALNPVNRDFSDLFSVYGKVYLPGLLPHNSLSIAAAYQTSVGGYKFPSGHSFLGYKTSKLLPRGFSARDINSDNFLATSLDYYFPLCYPEGGIGALLYFKRIRMNLGADYAQFKQMESTGKEWERIYSYGGDLEFDLNVFRQPDAATVTFKVSVYKPSNDSVWYTMGLSLPF